MMKHPVYISQVADYKAARRVLKSSKHCNQVRRGIRPNLIGSCWAKMFLLLAPVMDSCWRLLSWTRYVPRCIKSRIKRMLISFRFLVNADVIYREIFPQKKIIIRPLNLHNALLCQGHHVNDASIIYLSFFSRKKAKIFTQKSNDQYTCKCLLTETVLV